MRIRIRVVGVVMVVIAAMSIAGCQPSIGSGASAVSTSVGAVGALAADDPRAPVASPDSCHIGGDRGQSLPDPHCTPGALNPAVDQSSIATTICKSGWTATIRPPASYTDKLKREQIAAYGDTDTRSGDYEEDHLVSLELGGAPDDPRNLWPEPGASPNPKDKVENALHKAVCAHQVTLAAAQAAIATNWTTAQTTLGLPTS